MSKLIERLNKRLAPVVPPVNELTPYITQMNLFLELLTVESIRAQRPAPVVPPRPQPRAVPTPASPSNQRTILLYLIKKSDIDNPKEVESTSPGEFRWPEEPDKPTTGTPPCEFAMPGGQSPVAAEGSSADEVDTEPTWPREATSDILARMNTYKFVRIVNLEKLNLNERQGYERSIEKTNIACTVLSEGSSDTQELTEQPRDDTRRQEDTARFDWRVDLKDSSYRYDSLVETVGHTGQHGEVRPPHGTLSVGLMTTGLHQVRRPGRACRGGNG